MFATLRLTVDLILFMKTVSGKKLKQYSFPLCVIEMCAVWHKDE